MRAWAGALLGEQKEKRNLFLIFASLLLIMGEGDTASYAYALLHHGWRGTTGMATVLLMGAYILYEMAWGDIHAAPFVSAGSHVYAGQ